MAKVKLRHACLNPFTRGVLLNNEVVTICQLHNEVPTFINYQYFLLLIMIMANVKDKVNIKMQDRSQ